VSSLIFPLFDYCAAVFTDLIGQLKLKLKRLNACVRFISLNKYISPHYNTLEWLTVDNRREFLTCCFLFTFVPILLPISLSFSHLVPSRVLSFDLCTPICRISSYQHSFLFTAFFLWNSFLLSPRESESLNIFRQALFCHLRHRGRGLDAGSTRVDTTRVDTVAVSSTLRSHHNAFSFHLYTLYQYCIISAHIIFFIHFLAVFSLSLYFILSLIFFVHFCNLYFVIYYL